MATPRKDPARPERVLTDTRSHHFRRIITEEWLRARWASTASLCEIAQQAGCSTATLVRYAKRFCLPQRPRRAGIQGWDEVLTPDYLQAAYVDDQMSIEAIAAEVGCSSSTVNRWLAAYGIPRRGHQPGLDNLLYDDRLSRDFVNRRMAERANLADIAREVGCTITAVRLAVARHGLEDGVEGVRPPRPPCASADELRVLYEIGLSLQEIGSRLGVSRTKVRADLSRFGIRPYTRPGFRKTDGTWRTSRQPSRT